MDAKQEFKNKIKAVNNRGAYQFKDDSEWQRHQYIYLPRFLITTGLWASYSPAVRAIIPVLHRYNGANSCCPSIHTIAAVAGLSEKVVSGAIQELKNREEYKIEKKIGTTGLLKYFFYLPKTKKGNFKVSFSIFNSAMWHSMSNSAKSIYISLLCFGQADQTIFTDEDIEDQEILFNTREFDIINLPGDDINNLAELSGLTRRTTLKAIEELKGLDIIEEHPEEEEVMTIRIIISDVPNGFISGVNKKLNKSYRYKYSNTGNKKCKI